LKILTDSFSICDASLFERKSALTPKETGLPRVVPHLTVKGGMDALDFYVKAFGAEIVDRRMADDGARLLHGAIRVNGGLVMVCDEFPEWNTGGTAAPTSIGGTAVAMHIYLAHAREVDKLVDQAIAAGASVVIPVDDMFWGDRFGRVRDPFGHVWSIAAPSRSRG
jgi:PhnB protein